MFPIAIIARSRTGSWVKSQAIYERSGFSGIKWRVILRSILPLAYTLPICPFRDTPVPPGTEFDLSKGHFKDI